MNAPVTTTHDVAADDDEPMTVDTVERADVDVEVDGTGGGVDTAARAKRSPSRRFAIGIGIAAALSLLPYLAVLWDFGIAPFRTAVNGGIFSNFFDLQARAIMHGHLYVPKGSLTIEGFVVNGREYTYFPPGPALLRIPVLLFTHRFDGRLTAISMLLAWCTTAVVTGLLLWRVRVIVRGDQALTRFEIVAAALVEALVLCGSVVLFLAALPWVYHEVYAWSIAMSIGAFHSLLGVLERRSMRRVLALGGFTLGAMLCRATTGWACALTVFVVAGTLWWSERRNASAGTDTRRWSLWVASAGAVPLAIGSAVNWAKFSHPFMFPLQDQVWTHLNPHRRVALAANGGSLVSPRIFLSTAINYLRPDGIRFVPFYPFVTMPAHVAKAYGGAVLDQTYRTGSITACAPALLVLATIGTVAAFRRNAPAPLRMMRIPLVGAAAITGGIMFYGYIAYRYTSEFIPFLVLGAAIGVTVSTERVARSGRSWRIGYTTLLALGLLLGLATNSAFAIHEISVQNPGLTLRDYVVLRDKISNVTGHTLDSYITSADTLPPTSRADQLHIVGDCRALLLGTGEPLNPWAPVELRDTMFAIRHPHDEAPPSTTARTGEIPLATFTGWTTSTLVVQPVTDTTYRVVLHTASGDQVSPALVHLPAVSPSYLQIRALTFKGSYLVVAEAIPLLEVPMSEHNDEWATQPVLVTPVVPPAPATVSDGWIVSQAKTPAPASCTRLQHR